MKGVLGKLFSALDGSDRVLGMNRRNLEHIYPLNERKDYPLADDKLLTKHILAAAGVAAPAVIAVIESFYELRGLEEKLSGKEDFVLKPSKGSGGGGILVITARDANAWRAAGGVPYSIDDLKKHISDIIFGVFSFDLGDKCIVEERIVQHPMLAKLSPFGLPDLRVIVRDDRPLMAMLRVPTAASGGKANLHQGALGIGVELGTGTTTNAIFKGERITRHPDTGAGLIGIKLPHWEDSLDCAVKTAAAVPLKYIGVDVALSVRGPLVLEINARPGLEIQNANASGLRDALCAAEAKR